MLIFIEHQPKLLPDSSVGKEPTCNAGDLGLIPGLGRSPGEVKGYPLQYSGLESYMDCIVHWVAKTFTLPSNRNILMNCIFKLYGKIKLLLVFTYQNHFYKVFPLCRCHLRF